MRTDGEHKAQHSRPRQGLGGMVSRAATRLHEVSWRQLIRVLVAAIPTCNAVALLVQESLSDNSLSSVFPVWIYVGANTVAVVSTLASKICAQLLVNRDFARWYADEQ
jgi:hypothetical protein